MRIFAGAFKGRLLKTTTGPGFRPAMGIVREALFSILEARGLDWSETRVLDCFAGSGSLGFEAISRGAAHCAFIESAPYAAKVIQKNADILGLSNDQYSIIQSDALKALARPPAKPYSLVFIDPPYRENILSRVLAVMLKNNWLAEGALVNAEVEARAKVDPVALSSGLDLVDDRTYGQTRVLLWTPI